MSRIQAGRTVMIGVCTIFLGAASAYGFARRHADPTLQSLLAELLPNKSGVVVITDLMSCRTTRDAFSVLDTLIDQGIGVELVAVDQASQQEAATIASELNLKVDVRSDSADVLKRAIVASGYSLPVIAVLENGRLQAMLSGRFAQKSETTLREYYRVYEP